MKINTAIAFLLAGLSLWALIPESRSSRRSLAGQLSALAVLVIGVATYTEYLTGWDLGIDELFVNDSSIGISAIFPGRMAIGSAVLFVVFGAILGLLDYERAKGPIQALTLIAMGATTLPPVGYFYGVNSLYHIPPYGSMALQTAAAFVVLGVGILIARPDRGVMIILTSDTPGGFLTRRLLPAAIAIPLVIGWFVAQGQHAGALNVEARLTLVTLANVAVFLGLAYWCGVLLHRAELQRNQSDLKFRLAVESAPNGTVMIDEDGRIVLINTQTERMFGYDRSELTGQKVELLVPERFRAQHPDRRSDFFANPVVRSMGAGRELFGLRKDGSEFPVEIGLTPIKTDEGLLVLSAIVDITERKRTEQAVQQSAERFQALVNAAAQIVWTTDAEGTALDDSPSWRAFTGQTYAEYRSTGWLNALHPDDCPQVVELWRRAVAGKSPYHSEHRIRHVSGEWRWTVARGMPLLDPNGLVRGWVGMNTDITERKQAEEQLQRHQAELAHVSRVSTMGEMATGLAHEINQPLSAIHNYAQGCMRRLTGATPQTTELREALKQIASEARRASDVIRSVRRFVVKREHDRFPVNLNELVREVLQLTTFETRRCGVAIGLDLPDGLPPVMGDSIQLEQVILNLTRNAIESMHSQPAERRELRVNTRLHEHDRKLVEVVVSDTGVGLPPTAADRVFNAFFTTKADGLGMGLSISRSIVESHGGRLWAQSNPFGGATFHLTLPVVSTGATNVS